MHPWYAILLHFTNINRPKYHEQGKRSCFLDIFFSRIKLISIIQHSKKTVRLHVCCSLVYIILDKHDVIIFTIVIKFPYNVRSDWLIAITGWWRQAQWLWNFCFGIFVKFDPNETSPLAQTNALETSYLPAVNMAHGDHCYQELVLKLYKNVKFCPIPTKYIAKLNKKTLNLTKIFCIFHIKVKTTLPCVDQLQLKLHFVLLLHLQ